MGKCWIATRFFKTFGHNDFGAFSSRGDARFGSLDNLELYLDSKLPYIHSSKGNKSTVLFENGP